LSELVKEIYEQHHFVRKQPIPILKQHHFLFNQILFEREQGEYLFKQHNRILKHSYFAGE
jgi:hypothetical protein